MNERIKELADQCWNNFDLFGVEIKTPDAFAEKFAELIEQNCIDKFIKVWYEQGLDVRGAELDKFMLRYEELDDGN